MTVVPVTNRSVAEHIFSTFHSLLYLRHNQRRQEHLATLGLDLHGKQVLEMGAGIGDHTTFFVDRGCEVFAVEARPENCECFRLNFKASNYKTPPRVKLMNATVESARDKIVESFEVVYCYGLLYHLDQPEEALKILADKCSDLFLLETCVSYGEHEAINPVEENASSPTQAFSGQGCRPTRPWIMNCLRTLFPYVYMPLTQPAHEEFPTDWTTPKSDGTFTRAVFVASRRPLSSPMLTTDVPMQQRAA